MTRVVLVALLIASSVAAASPPTARLEIRGDACSLDGVVDRASALLDAPAIDPDAAAVFHVGLSALPSLHARVTYVDGDRHILPTRDIEASSCDELVDAVALVMSLVLRDAPPSREVERVDPTFLTVGRSDELAEESFIPAPPRHTRPSLEVAAAGGTSRSILTMLGVAAARGPVSGALAVGIESPIREQVGSGTIAVSSTRLSARACAHRGGFGVCGLLAAGWIRGEGRDLMDARVAYAPLAAVGLGIEWRRLVTRRIGARVFIDVEQLLTTTRFLVDDARVWSSEPRAAWTGIGAFLRWP